MLTYYTRRSDRTGWQLTGYTSAGKVTVKSLTSNQVLTFTQSTFATGFVPVVPIPGLTPLQAQKKEAQF